MDNNLCYEITRLARMLMSRGNEKTKPHVKYTSSHRAYSSRGTAISFFEIGF